MTEITSYYENSIKLDQVRQIFFSSAICALCLEMFSVDCNPESKMRLDH